MNKRPFLLFWLFIFIIPLYSQSKFPQIPELKSQNVIFKEYSNIVADNYKFLAAGKTPDMIFFSFKVTDKNMSLLSLASRCNISYDTIATLNRIPCSTESLYGKTLILPTAPGIFLYNDKNQNSLEILLKEDFLNSSNEEKCLYYNLESSKVAYIPNQRFSPTQRAFFLDSEIRLPLDKSEFWISSSFGKRKNPFSGEWKDHKGVDLAAAEGTPVFAIKDGNVAYCIEKDSTFGNYIIITHDNGQMTSVYAHLLKFCVQKYDIVKKGDIIGYVGSTGMTTGPHLHFEIRQGGVALDPEKKLKLE